MNTIWLIGKGTFGDAMRRKILNVFLLVALALIATGFASGELNPKQDIIIVKSLGLGIIALAGVFISVILFINLIPIEIERRTIYTILSKPVQRYEFLIGKFVGGLMTVFVNILLMGLAFVLLVAIKEHGFTKDVLDCLQGVLMIFFQIALVGGMALCFSVLVSPFVNFFLSFALYLLGSMDILETLARDPNHTKNPIITGFFSILHTIVPNFGNFNIQNPIIHPDVIIKSQGLYIAQNAVYALVYIAIFLTIAHIAFERREV